MKAQTQSDQEATLYVYDVIDDWWGIDAESFVKEVNSLNVNTLHVRINSPGGDVFTARAMQTALSQHPANVVVHVDGLAASAATFLAMAASEVRISTGAFFMIHKGWSFCMGNSDDMIQQSKLLDTIDQTICDDYSKRTGMSPDQVMTMMTEETWLDAEQAVSHGFADVLCELVEDESTAQNRCFDLSAYQNAPENYQPNHHQAVRAHLERRLSLIA